MRRTRAIGFVLTAVFLLGAMTASAASALPEYSIAEGKEEAVPGKVAFTGAAGPSKLKSSTGVTVECKADTSKGNIKGATTSENVIIRYTGCEIPAAKVECATDPGKAKGVITTESLQGKLAYASAKAGATEQPAARFEPKTAGTLFAKFSCASTVVEVARMVIGKVQPVNAPLSIKSEVVFEEQVPEPEVGCGKQALQFVSGAKPCVHLEAFGGSAWYITTETLIFQSPLKINA